MATLPPGPRAPAAWQTARWVLRPAAFLEECAARHGDPFTLRVLWSDEPLVLTADPDAAGAIFRDASTPGGPLRSGTSPGLLAPFAGARSILVLGGDDHLRQRRRLLPPFHGEALARFHHTIARIAHEHVSVWPRGMPLDTHERLRALTLDVILEVVFGSRRRDLHDAIGDALALTHRAPSLLAMSLLSRDLGPRSPYGAFRRAVARVDDLLHDLIDRTAPGDGSALALLKTDPDVDRGELRDMLVTLLAAGHETTASALAWALERLARHPDVVRWARAGGGDDRLGAVADETLRLRPVLSIAPRSVARPYDLRGHELPPGTQVAACLLLVQRDPRLWGPDARAFRPQRWLGPGTPPHPHAFVPWGGGTRRCVGAAFARLELVEVLRAVLARHDLLPDRAGPEHAVRRSVVLGPDRGGRVVLAPRTPA